MIRALGLLVTVLLIGLNLLILVEASPDGAIGFDNSVNFTGNIATWEWLNKQQRQIKVRVIRPRMGWDNLNGDYYVSGPTNGRYALPQGADTRLHLLFFKYGTRQAGTTSRDLALSEPFNLHYTHERFKGEGGGTINMMPSDMVAAPPISMGNRQRQPSPPMLHPGYPSPASPTNLPAKPKGQKKRERVSQGTKTRTRRG